MAWTHSESLNQSQRLAVEDSSPSLLIVAGPGTGKTRVLISKMMHEIRARQLAAERILCVTFSRKATDEMQDRLAEASPKVSELVDISTLHSFCVDLCTRQGFRMGLAKKARLLSEIESKAFLRSLADKLPLLSLLKTSSLEPILDQLYDFITQSKDAGLWPEDLLSYAQKLPDEDPFRSDFYAIGQIYALWQSRAFEAGLIDFGDSLLMAERLLTEFRQVRAEEQSAYDLIMVDEFQDTNWSQIKLLRGLCGPRTRIVAVGDDDQSIYRFRGASYSAFEFFLTSFPETRVIELTETYRLPEIVAKAASLLIKANGENRYRPDKSIRSKSLEHGEIVWIKAPSERAEAVSLANILQETLKKNPQSSTAILVRSQRHADTLVEELAKRNIGITRQSRSQWSRSPLLRDCLAFFKLVMDPKDRISYLRLLDSPFFRLPAETILTFLKNERSTPSGIPEIDRILDEFFVTGLRQPPSELLLQFLTRTKTVPHLLEKAPDDLKLLGSFLTAITELEALSKDHDLPHLWPTLEEMVSQGAGDRETPPSHGQSAVAVLTVHASKGLEFDTVIMPSLVSRRFPSNFSKSLWHLPETLNREKPLTKESHLCEERRLFYVGMTRAKKKLIVSSFEKRGTRSSLFLTDDLKDLWNQNPALIREVDAVSELPSFIPKPFERSLPATDTKTPSLEPLRLSYTQIEKYETCPLSYRFKYEFKIPVKTPVQMALGSVIHGALETFFKALQRDEHPTKQDLLRWYETYFTSERLQNSLLTDTHHALGLERLSLYHDSIAKTAVAPLEVEKDFVIRLGEHTIRGKIDRVDRVGSKVRIVDYKTGKAKSNDRAEDQKFAQESLQFSIYALAAKEVFGWDVESLVFDYVYERTQLSTSRSDDQIAVVKEKILNLASQIQNHHFPANPGFHCEWCEYKEICPAAVAQR